MNKRNNLVTIISKKGGVGKTFFSLNLAGVYSDIHPSYNEINSAIYIDANLENDDGELGVDSLNLESKGYIKSINSKTFDLSKYVVSSDSLKNNVGFVFPGEDVFKYVYNQQERLEKKADALIKIRDSALNDLNSSTAILDLNHVSVNDAYQDVWMSGLVRIAVVSLYDERVLSDIKKMFSEIYTRQRTHKIYSALDNLSSLVNNQEKAKDFRKKNNKFSSEHLNNLFNAFNSVQQYKDLIGTSAGPSKFVRNFYKKSRQYNVYSKDVKEFVKLVDKYNAQTNYKDLFVEKGKISLGPGKTIIVANKDTRPTHAYINDVIEEIRNESKISIDNDELFIIPEVSSFKKKTDDGVLLFSSKSDFFEKTQMLIASSSTTSSLDPFIKIANYIKKVQTSEGNYNGS